jgi:ferrous iron transport protein B
MSASDKIDRIVTNRWLALPIFAAVMFLVYFVSVSTVGTWATDWANGGFSEKVGTSSALAPPL